MFFENRIFNTETNIYCIISHRRSNTTFHITLLPTSIKAKRNQMVDVRMFTAHKKKLIRFTQTKLK